MAYFPSKHKSSATSRRMQKIFEGKNLLPTQQQTEELNEATIKFMEQFLPEAFQQFLRNLGSLRPTNPAEFFMDSLFMRQNPYQNYPALLTLYEHAVKQLKKAEASA